MARAAIREGEVARAAVGTLWVAMLLRVVLRVREVAARVARVSVRVSQVGVVCSSRSLIGWMCLRLSRLILGFLTRNPLGALMARSKGISFSATCTVWLAYGHLRASVASSADVVKMMSDKDANHILGTAESHPRKKKKIQKKTDPPDPTLPTLP